MALTEVNSLGIKDLEVKTGDIAADAVTGAKIADDAINSEHYTDGSIDTAHIADLNVTTAKVAADAITGAKIADDAIDSEHYTDGSIDTAHIADNQITLAKMAGGTDGQIITYDASGDPVAVGPGTDGQVLTSTGAGSPPAFETISTSDTLSNRNVIINGEMKINQRGTVSSITSSKYAGPDRWKANLNAGTWTVSQESDGPPGFGYSYKIVCTTADTSLGTGAIVQILHQLEGQDVQRFKKGTSSAQTFSLSFWCKSNYTNTYIAELYDNDNSRCVSKSFTVSSSDTWEKKTFSFPADTTGAFGNDNGASMRVYIKLAAGTDFTSGTLNTSAWIAQDNTKRAGGIGNLAGAVNRFFCVTGVQLEAGDTVTDYEHREYGDELARCHRYYQEWRAGSLGIASGSGGSTINFALNSHTVMRDHPSASIGGSGGWRWGDMVSWAGTASSPTLALYDQTDYTDKKNSGFTFQIGGFSGLTQYRTYQWEPNSTYKSTIQLSSEL